MAKQHTQNVDRFVSSTRRLIVIQILVAIIALVAAAAAAVSIWLAIQEQDELRAVRAEVDDATERAEIAIENQKEVEARNNMLLKQLSSARRVLQASNAQDYRDAANDLQDVAAQANDEDLYALVATARYRSALGAQGEARWSELVGAGNSALEAFKVSTSREDFKPEEASRFFLEYLGIACAQAKALTGRGQSPKSSLLNGLQAISLRNDLTMTPELEAEIASRRANNANPIVNQECSSGLLDDLGNQWSFLNAPAPNLLDTAFAIERAYLQIGRPEENALATKLGESLSVELGIQVPGVELINTEYRPSVRYYHDEQAEDAENIRDRLVAAANSLGETDWKRQSLPMIKLNLPDLPRDRIEIWLPTGGVEETPQLTEIRVEYFRRPADGLTVENTIKRLVPEGQYTVSTPYIEANSINMIACHRDAPPQVFEEFKVLAAALIEAGVPIRRVNAFGNPGKPTNKVEILASNSARAGSLISVEQVQSMQSCPF